MGAFRCISQVDFMKKLALCGVVVAHCQAAKFLASNRVEAVKSYLLPKGRLDCQWFELVFHIQYFNLVFFF